MRSLIPKPVARVEEFVGKAIMEQVDACLRRMDVDYVNLMQNHRFDDNTPVEETMEALHDVVKAGKALYIGAS